MVLAAALASGTAGCMRRASGTDRNIKDGTYTAEAEGYGGPLSVEVEIASGAIQSVKVTDEQESMTIADSALSDTGKKIVSNQSVNVDLSTGATVTSQAIVDAVSSCITQAGGSLDRWQKDCRGTDQDTVREESYQAAVIGGGISGIAATLRLQQLGISTVLIEKSSALGASLYYTDGLQLVTGSTLKKDGSTEKLREEINAVGNNEGDPALQDLFVNGLADTINWEISDLGISFESELKADEDYSEAGLAEMSDSAEELQTLFEKELKVSGAKVMTDTMVYELKTDEDGVCGLMAKSSDGTVYDIDADQIVIASGGYGNSEKLLPDVLYCGPAGDTGDLIEIGSSEDLQFALVNEDGTESLWPAVQADDRYAVSAEEALKAAVSAGAFLVNGEARRFASETDEAAVLDAVRDGVSAYLVMDSDMYSVFRSALLKNASDDLQAALKDEETGIDAEVKGSSVQEAAEKAGLDGEQLYQTLMSYQRSCTDGTDEQYGRDASTMKTLKSDGGYAVVPLTSAVWATLGGLSADENLNLCSTDGEVYKNVYVIGSAAGNVFGTGVPAGAGTTWAFVSAKAAADRIAFQAAADSSSSPAAES